MGPNSYRAAVNSKLKLAKQQAANDRLKWGAHSPPTFPKAQLTKSRSNQPMTTTEAPPALPLTAIQLFAAAEAKLPAVLKRIGKAEICYSATQYTPLCDRISRARHYGLSQQAAEKLVADLDAIMAAGDEDIRRMCQGRGVDLSGWSGSMRALAAEANTNALRGMQQQPRHSPEEMVSHFKQRGIDLAAHGDDLHASPRHRVTEADTVLLRAHKADILSVLRDGAVVI